MYILCVVYVLTSNVHHLYMYMYKASVVSDIQFGINITFQTECSLLWLVYHFAKICFQAEYHIFAIYFNYI